MSKKRGAEEPESEVDFHHFWPGVTPREIEEFVDEAIEGLKSERIRVARFIIGKGLHSQERALIPGVVMRRLKLLKEQKKIKTFNEERLANGGINSGALIVVL